MIWFFTLEHVNTSGLHVVHCFLDNYIPFNEYFIIAYFLWFPYMFFCIGYFFLKDKKEFYQLGSMFAIGLTLCLLFYTFYPTTQNLRPASVEGNSIFAQLIRWLYAFDTPSNVCPSIHVYNAVIVHIAIWKSSHLKQLPIVRYGSLILMIFISASTVCLKQHSIIDVIAALILVLIMYLLVYVLGSKIKRFN